MRVIRKRDILDNTNIQNNHLPIKPDINLTNVKGLGEEQTVVLIERKIKPIKIKYN
jgi:hypothetical protein